MRIFKKGTKGKKTEEFGGSNTVMLVVLMPHDSNFQLNDTRGDESFIRHSLPPVIFKGLWAHLRKKKTSFVFKPLSSHTGSIKILPFGKRPKRAEFASHREEEEGEKKKDSKNKVEFGTTYKGEYIGVIDLQKYKN